MTLNGCTLTPTACLTGGGSLAERVNPSAYEHLLARDPHKWCRTYFRTEVACETVENGIAECFNTIILDARKKSLLALFEEIRLYMMDRFYHVL
uniref:Uncharacterized protein n=1 Tax=Lactuca sativa TaxID=4236 RepID=A0A9R1WWD0_LACSA|nr:hypothetical protein LSAT_V11C800426550 [Lactuca sativa]